MNADPMVQTCFRHQHPEAYGRLEAIEPNDVPSTLRYGTGDQYVPEAAVFHEEPIGNGERL